MVPLSRLPETKRFFVVVLHILNDFSEQNF